VRTGVDATTLSLYAIFDFWTLPKYTMKKIVKYQEWEKLKRTSKGVFH
jgi:hypothetical protein